MINAKKTLGLVSQRMNLLDEASNRRVIGCADVAEFVMRVLLMSLKSFRGNSKGAFHPFSTTQNMPPWFKVNCYPMLIAWMFFFPGFYETGSAVHVIGQAYPGWMLPVAGLHWRERVARY